jgi:hypothetical protein
VGIILRRRLLNIGLDASFDDTKDYRGMRERRGDINSTNICTGEDEPFCRILSGSYNISVR